MSGDLRDCKSDEQLDGKVAIVTGGTSGIGFEAAKNLSKRGAKVIISGRNPTRLADAKDKIIKYSRNNNVIAIQMDFESLSSIRSFADTTVRTEPRVDILINNIGAVGLEDRLTEDGLQLTMQVNYFGTFLLTFLLFPLLKASAPSRVVNVSSLALIFGHIDIDHWNDVGKYSSLGWYANGKLAMTLFTVEMEKRIKGSGVNVYSLDPGVAKTQFSRNYDNGFLKIGVQITQHTFGRPSDVVAAMPVFLAIDPKVASDSGKHYKECRVVHYYWFLNDTLFNKRVWDETKRLVKISVDEDWELRKCVISNKIIDVSSGVQVKPWPPLKCLIIKTIFYRKQVTNYCPMHSFDFALLARRPSELPYGILPNQMHNMSGELKDCKSDEQLNGKVAIVTGVTSGIGLEAAKNLSKRGAKVIISGRNPTKLADARDNIIKYSRNNNVIARQMDFESLSSIRSFADTTLLTEPRVDILINNIGGLGLEDRLTEDGLQLTMQVNYFGTFLLTFLLFPLLKASAPSRVVNTSSISMILGHIDIDHWNDVDKYSNLALYANAKLAITLFTVEMARRVEGSGVHIYSLDPGFARSELYRRYNGVFLKTAVDIVLKNLGRPSDVVAAMPVFLAIDPKVASDSGKHYLECKEVYNFWFVNDSMLNQRVWDETKRLVRITTDEDWEYEKTECCAELFYVR